MDNKTENIVISNPVVKPKKKIALSIIAILLTTAAPVFFACLMFVSGIGSFATSGILAVIPAGIILGVVSLCFWKRTHIAGRVLSIIAIAVPIVVIITIISLFATGVLGFM